MNNKTNVRSLAATLITIGSLAGGAKAQFSDFQPGNVSVQQAQEFVSSLNDSPDFNVSLLNLDSLQTSAGGSFVIIYDPLTDSNDAINIDQYDPNSLNQTAAEYYFAESARSFFDLEDVGIGRYRDVMSGILFGDSSFIFNGLNEYQSAIRQMSGITINGAHHRTLIDAAGSTQGVYSWATGDFAHFDQLDADQVQGEIGASYDFGIPNFRAGLAVGYSSLDQDLSLGGSSDVEGEFFLLEADYAFQDTPLTVSSLLYFGDFDAKINRSYFNVGLGGVDRSTGRPDIETIALRLRADWELLEREDLALNARVSYTNTNTNISSFTESGGGFPVSFDEQDDTLHEFRLGLDSDFQMCDNVTVRVFGEVGHRIDDGQSISVNIGPIVGARISGQDLDETFVRAGAELVYEIDQSQRIFLSLTSSSSDVEPIVAGAVSYGIRF